MVHQVPFKTALKGLVAPNRARESKLFIQARSSQPQETISSAIFSIYLQFFLFTLYLSSHLYFPHCSIPASALSLILLLSHFSRVQLRATQKQQPTRLPRPWDSPGKDTGAGCHVLLQCRKVKSESEVAQSCPTLRDPMDCSLPGSSVHGMFQARGLQWGAINSVTYSLIQLDGTRFHLWRSYLFPFHFNYLPTPWTWSTQYTPAPKKLTASSSLFLELQAPIFKCLPLYPPSRSSTSPQNHLNLIIYSS